jgi:uncharacterized membrane protein
MRDSGDTSAIIRKFAATSLFAAIIFLMTFTPVGFINLIVINATIVHVPVIIGSILLGPRIGACLGVMFGAASVIRNTMMPNVLSFAFSPFIAVPGTEKGSIWAVVICFVPRILVGVIPWYADRFLSGLAPGNKKQRVVSLFSAGISGSITNTILVMHLMFFLFRDAFAQARNVPADAVYRLVLSIIATNGIPEALAAGVLASAVCKAVEAYRRRG